MMDKQYLQEMCRMVASKLPDNHGFVILTFPFGNDPGQRLQYASNANRTDVLNAMKEFIIRNGAEEDWMKHIK